MKKFFVITCLDPSDDFTLKRLTRHEISDRYDLNREDLSDRIDLDQYLNEFIEVSVCCSFADPVDQLNESGELFAETAEEALSMLVRAVGYGYGDDPQKTLSVFEQLFQAKAAESGEK